MHTKSYIYYIYSSFKLITSYAVIFIQMYAYMSKTTHAN